MPWITKEGRSVDEARDAAIAASGMLADDLEIEVVSEGAKGLFGLGGEPAVVRVRPKGEGTDFRHAFRDDITPAGDDGAPSRDDTDRAVEPAPREDAPSERAISDEEFDDGDEAEEEDKQLQSERREKAAELGAEIVRGILERMELQGEISTRIAGGTVYVEVAGDELGILIGRSGATLEALQELVRAGIQRRLKTRQAVVVDVEGYWDRRRKPRGGREGGGREEQRQRSGGKRGGRRRRGGGGTRREPDGNRREPDGNR